MAQAIRIRRVRPSDGSLVQTLRLAALQADPLSFAATYAHEAAFDVARWDDWAESHATGTDRATLIAQQDGAPVGIVAAYRDQTDEQLFHVFSMWVASEVRRTGLGGRLLGEIEVWIAECGAQAQLAVADTALAAARLYKRSGYVADGEQTASPHTPSVNHTSLQKQLQPT